MTGTASIGIRRLVATALAAAALFAAGPMGCGRPAAKPAPAAGTAVAWAATEEGDLDEVQQRQLERAVEARDAMFSRLLATLMQTISAEGTAGAIAVCQVEAPRIAAEVGATKRLAIGRTSWKLRNPGNTPPGWAEPVLESRPGHPVYLGASDGRFGALLPIRVMTPCLQCHGPAESIAPEVSAALAAAYPEDQATGFAEGDLRGWFWIEVPAP